MEFYILWLKKNSWDWTVQAFWNRSLRRIPYGKNNIFAIFSWIGDQISFKTRFVFTGDPKEILLRWSCFSIYFAVLNTDIEYISFTYKKS